MQEFTGITQSQRATVSISAGSAVAQTVGLQSAAATRLGLGRKAGRQAGFLPLTLLLLLLKVPSMEVTGAFPTKLFQSMFLRVSRCFGNDWGSPVGCAVVGSVHDDGGFAPTVL